MLYVPICTFNTCNSEWLSIKTVFCPLTDKPQFTNQELLKYTTVGSHDPTVQCVYYTLYLPIVLYLADYRKYIVCVVNITLVVGLVQFQNIK